MSINEPQPRFPEGTPEYAAYRQELQVELDKFARGEEPYPYRRLIDDPRSDGQIDVTGWDLDALNEILIDLNYQAHHGSPSDYILTDDQIEALSLPTSLWTLDHPRVNEALARLVEIVEEARYQRDLPRAMDALHGGRPLSVDLAAAYERYIADIGAV
jgi:hypothetical protein